MNGFMVGLNKWMQSSRSSLEEVMFTSLYNEASSPDYLNPGVYLLNSGIGLSAYRFRDPELGPISSSPHKLIRPPPLNPFLAPPSPRNNRYQYSPFKFAMMNSTSPKLPDASVCEPTPNTATIGQASSESPATGTSHTRLRSCTFCRSRKIKCDRQQPCANCVRTTNQCIYPSGSGRAPKRPRPSEQEMLRGILKHMMEQDALRRGNLEGSTVAGTKERSFHDTPSGTKFGYVPPTIPNPADELREIDATRKIMIQQIKGVRDMCLSEGHQSRALKLKETLQKFSDLEETIQTLSGDTSGNLPSKIPSLDGSNDSSQMEQQFGRLAIDDTRSCYVSNVLWATLSDDIEELRELLDDPWSEPDDPDDKFDKSTEASFGDTASDQGSNAAIMGFHTLAQSLCTYHPSVSMSVALLEIFQSNVAPTVHIFHMPTMICSYWDAVGSYGEMSRPTEALLFAIYYSAVISMESHQCEQILHMPRATALKHLQFATQQAMARANLLNTQSMVLVQAAVLFLSALRNEDASRTVWSLTALVVHIARSMGLHRDGAAFGLRPLETELRRRLWWHICLLDIRSSEYHGCEPIVHESMFDTRTPLNINDSDLTAEMIEPPAEREGATEMTFCLIRCESMRVVWKTGYTQPNMPPLGQPTEGLSFHDRTALAKGLEVCLQERYLKHCDPSNPFSILCVTVAQLIIARTWLVVYYPLIHKDRGAVLPSNTRDRLFLTAIKVLEMSNILLTNPDLAQWQWHSKTHIQWHAVAFVLSEICARPPSADCDRAWEYVQTVYNRWKMKEYKGNRWRPIKRLKVKARYTREIQRTSTIGTRSNSVGPAPPFTVPGFIPREGVTPESAVQTSSFDEEGRPLPPRPLDPLFFEMFSGENMFNPPPILANPGELDDISMADWIMYPYDSNMEY
ncbi:uncharacterized protein N7483_004131 [Penicillium malachiteum]|uniref:uncharacterized protein n=1 Tax=Penicillium malachiteum TaxID=1324776 RepID=UPI0025498A4C|nr:uncharacterized protein N7483_004131 [Penicillium malachiteum]KAJ5729623.1 hypothetical protein N7483_004131 [Penicillium malachiteum]